MKKLINRQAGPVGRWALGLLPFVILAVLYLVASDARLDANPASRRWSPVCRWCRRWRFCRSCSSFSGSASWPR
mgnify:CR=1 FL=1